MLRLAGPDVYDSWVAGETKWTDPAVVAAFEAFGDVVEASRALRAVGFACFRRRALGKVVVGVVGDVHATPPGEPAGIENG